MTTETEKPIPLSDELKQRLKNAISNLFPEAKRYADKLYYLRLVDEASFDSLMELNALLISKNKELLRAELEVAILMSL